MIKYIPEHQHLLIRAYSKSPIKDPNVANQMLLDLVQLINMNPVTTPQSVYVDTPGLEGLTGSINLATSHIAYHSWDDETGLLMFDVYSCKKFDIDLVMNFLIKRWNLETNEISRLPLLASIDRNDNDTYQYACGFNAFKEDCINDRPN